MSGIVVLIIIFGLLWLAAQESIKRSEGNQRIANEAIHHLPSFLRECTGMGPWLQMDEFYRNHYVDVKCTSCSKDAIFVSNANPKRETEFIDVHFAKGKLRIMHGKRVLFDGDPLNLVSYPQETFPLKVDSPPPKESGSYYSIWTDHFKDASNMKRKDGSRVDSALLANALTPNFAPDPKSEPDKRPTDDKLRDLLKAAELGDGKAQFRLAEFYGDPKRTSPDFDKAAPWFRKAAEQGNTDAQQELGTLCQFGFGVPRSYSEAYFWFYLSAQGKKGIDHVDEDWLVHAVAQKLTPLELSQARERVAEWSAARQRELDRQKPATEESDSKDPVLEPNIPPNQIASQPPKLIIHAEILQGMSIEEALEHFRDQVNRPNTIFSTEHWLTPKLEHLRMLLSDPITAVQAQTLSSVLHGGIYMNDLIEWLESPGIEWKDFFAYREQEERDASWGRWKQQEAEDRREEGFSNQLEPCPKCGSKSVIEILYGFPTEEQQEAARRGAIALGGCMLELGSPKFCCKYCEHSWPQNQGDEDSETGKSVPIALSKTDALRSYAVMMNTLDAKGFAPLLADDFHYASQWVFSEIETKQDYVYYITGKLQAVRTSGKKVWAEIGSCNSGPCVVMAESEPGNLIATVLVEVEGDKIKRMDLCCVPSPYSAERSGDYPK